MIVYGFHTEALQPQSKQEKAWAMHRASFEARIGGRQSEAQGKRRDHTGALDLKGHEARESALWTPTASFHTRKDFSAWT